MQTRETLLRRADVPNEDIDDIIGIAAELQEDERRAAEGASVAEVQAVASELEIDPRYVEQAIETLHARRREEAAARTERADTTRRALLSGGAGVLGVGLVLALGLGGSAVVRSGRVAEAQRGLEQAQRGLDVVLERQASLAPQLVAIAGGDARGLDALARTVTQADTVEARLQASDALATELATRLGSLPPAADEATAQQRLSLQHELTGTQNRITVERRRYEEALLGVDQASRGCGG